MGPMIDSVTTCWSCAEELPREARTCPSCRHPQDREPPVRQRFGRPGGPPSVVYLFLLPILGMWASHQRGFGATLGALLGLASWVCVTLKAKGWLQETTT